MAENNVLRALELMGQAVQLLSPSSSTSEQSNRLSTVIVQPSPSHSRAVEQSPTPPLTATPRQSSSSVLQELRRNFEPYDRRGRTGSAGIPARTTARSVRNWTHSFCCLNSPETDVVPSIGELCILEEHGLGTTVVVMGGDSREEEVKLRLRSIYPKLQNVEFELLRGIGTGRRKPLSRISRQNAVPCVPELNAARLGVIYIRPLSAIVIISTPVEERNSDTTAVTGSDFGTNAIATSVEISTEGGRGCGASEVPRVNQLQSTEGYATMEEFRASVYGTNVGTQLLVVQRDDVVNQVLGVYKDHGFDILKAPHVVFLGEAGRDVGALRNEYFISSMSRLINGKFSGLPLFEGSDDHKVPCQDVMLLTTGVYSIIGKFIAHSAIHTGIGFVGLSLAICEYLITEDVTEETPFTVTVDDVADLEIRDVIRTVETMNDGSVIENEILSKIRDIARAAGYHNSVTTTNWPWVKDLILYHEVIRKRKPQLEAMKESFRSTGLLGFLSGRHYLIGGVFPKQCDLEIPMDIIINKIDIVGTGPVVSFVEDYFLGIGQNAEGGPKAVDILRCWTGWPFLPQEKLKLTIEQDCIFMVRACFSEIKISASFSKEQVKSNLDLAFKFGVEGFGSI